MSNIIKINAKKSLTNEVFLKQVWNQFYDYLREDIDIILDLRNIDFIDSTVLPKICCLGYIAKSLGHALQIIPSFKVARYLSNMDFWEIVELNNIFSYDKKYCEYSSETEKVTNAFFCMDRERLEKKYKNKFEFKEGTKESTKFKYYVKAELVGEGNAVDRAVYSDKGLSSKCKSVIRVVSEFKDYSENTSEDKIIDALVELVHNSVWHSQGVCFFMVQACTYDGNEVGIEVSVADTGVGLYRSLVSKEDEFVPKCYKKSQFKRITNLVTQNYCSMVEALVYRKESRTRGLYNIMEDLAAEPQGVDTELNLINRNVSCHIEKEEITKLVNGEYKTIISEKGKLMRQKKDIGYAFSIDINIKKKK